MEDSKNLRQGLCAKKFLQLEGIDFFNLPNSLLLDKYGCLRFIMGRTAPKKVLIKLYPESNTCLLNANGTKIKPEYIRANT